jgi:hypothetical protein
MTSTTSTAIRFFIAVPAVEANQTAIYGIGHTEEEAVADAYADTRTQVPTVAQGTAPSRYVDGDTERTWTVTTTQGSETHYTEADADHQVQGNSFVAQECTERLFLSVQKGSVDRWTTNGRLQDLDVNQGAVDDALDEVKDGLDGEHASTIAALMAEDALDDAHTYVDAFIRQNSDSDYHDAVEDDAEFRLALDLTVRDHLLELIAERKAAYTNADDAEEEQEEVLPRVESDHGEIIEAEHVLPTSFTYYDAKGTEYAYRWIGESQYEVRRWMPEDEMWWVEASDLIGDEVTVEIFLMLNASA